MTHSRLVVSTSARSSSIVARSDLGGGSSPAADSAAASRGAAAQASPLPVGSATEDRASRARCSTSSCSARSSARSSASWRVNVASAASGAASAAARSSSTLCGVKVPLEASASAVPTARPRRSFNAWWAPVGKEERVRRQAGRGEQERESCRGGEARTSARARPTKNASSTDASSSIGGSERLRRGDRRRERHSEHTCSAGCPCGRRPPPLAPLNNVCRRRYRSAGTRLRLHHANGEGAHTGHVAQRNHALFA